MALAGRMAVSVEETTIKPMNTSVPSDLEGRSIQEQDSVDLHRRSCYHLFFGLDPERDRPLALHWPLSTSLRPSCARTAIP
jgi:hypothetical protein